MKTYTNTTLDSVYESIAYAFKIERVRDYADTLVDFFCGKVEAWTTAYRNDSEKWEEKAERKYGSETGSRRYELFRAMDDLKTVIKWRDTIGQYIKFAVRQELAKPTEIEYTEGDNGIFNAKIDYYDALYNKYHDDMHVQELFALRERTHGLNDEEYNDLFLHYGII